MATSYQVIPAKNVIVLVLAVVMNLHVLIVMQLLCHTMANA